MEKVKLHTPDMVMLLETKTRSSRYVFSKEGTGNAIYACNGDRAKKQGGNSRSERNDKRKEYKNGWTGGSYHVMFCLDTHETKRRKKGHFAYDPRWGRHELCIDELRLELRAEYQNDIFDYGKVKELEFKLKKALVGKVKELEFKFKISHIFREGNHRVRRFGK
ncbi:unnamed protein product [Prunus armeniaca]